MSADTQANEGHLIPKPLEEHVPGAWNFTNHDLAIADLASHAITVPTMASRLKLSEEARAHLLDRVPTMFPDRPALEREWRELEDALTEILFPPRRWMP